MVVVGADSKDLNRTAYRLRIPVERLKNVRKALQEATELAKRVRPIQIAPFSQLGNHWIMLHRSKAESSIKGLVSDLRLAAQEAKEAIDNFDAAMHYVRTIPDEQARLSTLIAIVEWCRRPF